MDKKLIEQAKLELARRSFYDYCTLLNGDFYKEDRIYLKEMCNGIQDFIENAKERFLIVNVAPRHGKSFTATNLCSWLLGKDRKKKIMTGSYNEILSTTFARQVRDTILNKKVSDKIVYSDIFPNTKIKDGESSANIWALEGNTEKSYLATSPTGTATGLGANIIIIDDVIKNSEEAYNENALEKHWNWLVNTMLQRTESSEWKVILIMTRWSENDLAGKVMKKYKDVRVIKFPAVQKDGSMLCEELLSYEDYLLKTQEMNPDIAEANYNQTPIEIKGRLYGAFKTWDVLPEFNKKYNITDTADTGSDFLCSIDFIEYQQEAYITDIVFTDEKMEITEELVANMLVNDKVNESTMESNNGGRGFARNVERIIKEKYKTNKVVIRTEPQTKNKESRILTSSAWVTNHVYMPMGWDKKYPEFYKQVTRYLAKGKNAHDDGPDVLASIYEQLTGKAKPRVANKPRGL